MRPRANLRTTAAGVARRGVFAIIEKLRTPRTPTKKATSLVFLSGPIAEAGASGVKSSSMNVLQMHHKGLPLQKMSDMTFVFSDD